MAAQEAAPHTQPAGKSLTATPPACLQALQNIQNQEPGDQDAFSDITDPQAVLPGPDSLPKISRADISNALKVESAAVALRSRMVTTLPL